MFFSYAFFLYALPHIFILQVLAQNIPQIVRWSPRSHGPDGPWNSISVSVGSPPQRVDLLPGGFWESDVLRPSVCSGQTGCDIPRNAGFYEPSQSKSVIEIPQTGATDNSAMQSAASAMWSGTGVHMFDTLTVPMLNGPSGNNYDAAIENFDMFVIEDAHETLPDGTEYPVQMGKLTLGSPNANQTWSLSTRQTWNGTLLPNSFFEQGRAPSNSYGLHVGSPGMKIPGSLTIGGFDQVRVVGPVSSQGYAIEHLPIDLLDISLSVMEGFHVLPFESKSGLLAEANSSVGTALPVHIEAPLPYMYLPRSTCDAITRYLPVTYQKKYGLYFWNTDSPLYESLITSPTVLSFTFRLNQSLSQNFTIHVPLALLNLTLTSPLVESPTSYFPLRPMQGPQSNYALGRAFLQAAFIGVNWQTANGNGDGTWFLAQAPGPNIPSQIRSTAIKPTDDSIIASDIDWKDTWKGVWKVIQPLELTPNGTSPETQPVAPPKQSLAKGVIIGIAVGAAALAACMVVAFMLYRRRSRKAPPTEEQESNHDASGIEVYHGESPTGLKRGYQVTEKDAGYLPAEMDSNKRIAELSA